MEWYQYAMCFFSGAFAANFIPHFVSGISGRDFPTPFAKPPGVGLSPPLINTGWGLANLLVALVLQWGSRLQSSSGLLMHVVAFAGFAVMSLMLSKFFGRNA